MINQVNFLITDQCNSFCKYCYVDALPTQPTPVLELDRVLDFLKVFRENNGRVVHFSGGEVLLYPEIERVFEYAKGLGLLVRIFTNGLALDREKFERIRGFIDTFSISLDGPEEVHDSLRGVKGAYRKVIEILELFKENRIDYSLQMTVGRSNLPYIDHVAQIAHQYDAGGVKLADMMKVGRGQSCPEDYLTEDDLLTLKRKSIELSEQYTYRPIFQTNLYTREEIDFYFKTDTLAPIFWIDAAGDLCLFTTANKKYFKIGHISEFPFNDLEAIKTKHARLMEQLFASVKGKKICDLFEEIELMADSF